MRAYITYFGYYGWLLFCLYLSMRERNLVTKKDRIGDKTVTRYSWFFALLAIIPLIYLAGWRGFNFGDTGAYRISLENAPSSFGGIRSYMGAVSKDKAFYLFLALFKSVFGNRSRLLFVLIALFQGLCLVKLCRKYSENLLISLFIFVASNDFLSYMENGIRQFCAVCIILLASRFIFERKYIFAIGAVVIASFFHQSALLMIPVIFIIQGDPWNKSTVFMLFLSLIAVIFVNQFTDILDNMLADTQYTNVVTDWISIQDNGTNPLRVAVFSVPAILSLVGLRYIREENDPIINVCVNMSVASAGLYLVSMATSGIFIGRLPIYVSVYANCILLPWELNHIFNKGSSAFMKRAMIVSFLLFYYYQIHIAWSII